MVDAALDVQISFPHEITDRLAEPGLDEDQEEALLLEGAHSLSLSSLNLLEQTKNRKHIKLSEDVEQLQQEVHGVKDIHLHSMGHQLLLRCTGAQIVAGFLGDRGEALQQAFQCTT